MLDAGHAVYPHAASVLGVGVGYLVGRLVAAVWMPASGGVAWIVSLAVGISVFLFVVLGPSSLGIPKQFSLAAGASVQPPSMKIADSVIYGQVAFAIAAGTAAVSLVTAVTVRTLVKVAVAVVSASLAALGMAVGASSVTGAEAVSVERTSVDFACVDGLVRVCATDNEEPGARLLSSVMASAYQGLPAATLPTDVIQMGIAAEPVGSHAVPVARMPDSTRQGWLFAGEMIVRSAGCTAGDVGDSDQVIKLLTWFRDGSTRPPGNAEVPAWVVDSVLSLDAIC